jgi:3-methyladenine DNA glycosylase AlkD
MKNPETLLKSMADPRKAARQRSFFKTGKGEYAEHDKFLGITVPEIRRLAKSYRHLTIKDFEKLLKSPWNEVRLFALIVMAEQYRRGEDREAIFNCYIKNLHGVNNWNLVDASAHLIVGAHLLERDRRFLYNILKSKNLWERRVAIVATWAFIRADSYSDTLKISYKLLKDNHDLMHKSCGWMLREVGKRDTAVLEKFLQKHHAEMPRTMLRYAIERFPEKKRRKYLKGDLLSMP